MDDSRISDRQPKNQPAGQPERAAYRRLQVLKYRAAGVSYRDIAESLGTGLGTVFRDDKTALGELAKLTNQETALRRALEDTRLDNYLLKLQADLQSDDPESQVARHRPCAAHQRAAQPALGLGYPSRRATGAGDPNADRACGPVR